MKSWCWHLFAFIYENTFLSSFLSPGDEVCAHRSVLYLKLDSSMFFLLKFISPWYHKLLDSLRPSGNSDIQTTLTYSIFYRLWPWMSLTCSKCLNCQSRLAFKQRWNSSLELMFLLMSLTYIKAQNQQSANLQLYVHYFVGPLTWI